MTPQNRAQAPATERARGNTTQAREIDSRHAAPRQSRKRTRWTPHELDLLREHYPKGGTRAVIAAGVNRTATAIHDRARKHGLRSHRPPATLPPPDARALVLAHQLAPRQPILRPTRPARVTDALHALAERAAREPGWTNERYEAAQERIKEGDAP